jgi:hypothetical protein
LISREFLASTGGKYTHIFLGWSARAQGNVFPHASEVILIIHAEKQREWPTRVVALGVHAVFLVVVFQTSFLNAGVHLQGLHVVHVPWFPNAEVYHSNVRM